MRNNETFNSMMHIANNAEKVRGWLARFRKVVPLWAHCLAGTLSGCRMTHLRVRDYHQYGCGSCNYIP